MRVKALGMQYGAARWTLTPVGCTRVAGQTQTGKTDAARMWGRLAIGPQMRRLQHANLVQRRVVLNNDRLVTRPSAHRKKSFKFPKNSPFFAMAMHADWDTTRLSGIHLLLENYFKRLVDDEASGKSVKTISADAFELSNGKPHKDRTFKYDERRLCKLAIRNMRMWARKGVKKPNAVEWEKHGELINGYHTKIGHPDTDDEDVDGLDGDDSEPDEEEDNDEADGEEAGDRKLADDDGDANGEEDEDNDDEYEPEEGDDDDEEEEEEAELDDDDDDDGSTKSAESEDEKNDDQCNEAARDVEEAGEEADDHAEAHDDDDGSKKLAESENEKDDDKSHEVARDVEEAGEKADDHAEAHDDINKRKRDDTGVEPCEDVAVDHETAVASVKAVRKKMRVPKKA